MSTKPYGSRSRDDARVVALMTAIACFAAGLVHVAAAADHDQPLMMAGFEVVAVLQAGLGALLLTRRAGRPVLAAGLALMLSSIALWALSRTVGLGFVPGGHAEPIGFRDAAAVLFELIACVGLWELLAGARRPAAPPGFPGSPVAAMAVLALALGAPAVLTGGHSHPGGHDGAGAVHAGGGGEHARAGGGEHEGREHARRGGGHGAGEHGAGSGGSGHDGHGTLAAGGHPGHAAGAAQGHAHDPALVAAHPGHAAAPGTAHAGPDHEAGPGASHDPGGGHGTPGGGGHGPGHGTPAPDPPAPAPTPTPEQQVTQFVEDEIDKLVPG